MLLLHVLAVCLCLTSIIKTPEMGVYTVIALRECLREKQTHGGYYNQGRGNNCFSHGPFWDFFLFYLRTSLVFIDVLKCPDFSVQCHPIIHTHGVGNGCISALFDRVVLCLMYHIKALHHSLVNCVRCLKMRRDLALIISRVSFTPNSFKTAFKVWCSLKSIFKNISQLFGIWAL